MTSYGCRVCVRRWPPSQPTRVHRVPRRAPTHLGLGPSVLLGEVELLPPVLGLRSGCRCGCGCVCACRWWWCGRRGSGSWCRHGERVQKSMGMYCTGFGVLSAMGICRGRWRARGGRASKGARARESTRARLGVAQSRSEVRIRCACERWTSWGVGESEADGRRSGDECSARTGAIS